MWFDDAQGKEKKRNLNKTRTEERCGVVARWVLTGHETLSQASPQQQQEARRLLLEFHLRQRKKKKKKKKQNV